MATFLPFFSGPPPSKLGFVAKPEMPPHINILFRARPPLETLKCHDERWRCWSYDPLAGLEVPERIENAKKEESKNEGPKEVKDPLQNDEDVEDELIDDDNKSYSSLKFVPDHPVLKLFENFNPPPWVV